MKKWRQFFKMQQGHKCFIAKNPSPSDCKVSLRGHQLQMLYEEEEGFSLTPLELTQPTKICRKTTGVWEVVIFYKQYFLYSYLTETWLFFFSPSKSQTNPEKLNNGSCLSMWYDTNTISFSLSCCHSQDSVNYIAEKTMIKITILWLNEGGYTLRL